MPSYNKVLLIGNLTRDPALSYLPSQTPVVEFGLATNRKWTDKDTGEKKQRTEWHRIVAWRRLGEICGEYLSKGRQVYVEGKIQTRSWEKDGITRYTTEIVASDVQFLGGRDSAREGMPPEDTSDLVGPDPSIPDKGEDDIPF